MKLKLFLLILTSSILLMGCVENRYPVTGEVSESQAEKDENETEKDPLLQDNLDRVTEVLDELSALGFE